MNSDKYDYDYIIIGSGFGGSVSALRLSEKGYRVLVIEKGKWWNSKDFAKTNWNLKRWMWLPALRFWGILKLTYYRHVGILSGVGVGGGSLVYANTLPIPKLSFFTAQSWSHLVDWEEELKEFYSLALKMLGANKNPRMETGDIALKEIASDMNKEKDFHATNVAVYFGEPGETVSDPYFEGKGPNRTGCIFCGACMVGCRHNAKNTLDKNYLYLAQKNGAEIQAESMVVDVKPKGAENGSDGYEILWEKSTSILFKKRKRVFCKGVIFSGGVLGTVQLLLSLKKSSLPNLSDKVGCMVRTNSEALIPITSFDKSSDFSKGVAIGSILHTGEHTHMEPVRYSKGSGFWRLFILPRVNGKSFSVRITRMFADLILHPIKNMKILFVRDWAKQTQVLLFMQSLDSTLKFSKGWFGKRMKTNLEKGKAPTPFIPEANKYADLYAAKLKGKPMMPNNEVLFGMSTTAHILGGAVMGKDKNEGVINKNNRVFGYENLYVCDGSMVSANPGVNPSLTITAISERAMSKIPEKSPGTF